MTSSNVKDNKDIETKLFSLKKELLNIKSEIETLKRPPLIIGTIKKLLPNKKSLVKLSTGQDFIVSVSNYIPKNLLSPGAIVSLNKQTLAVIDVLPLSFDPKITRTEILKPTNITFEDIGGLEKQKIEIREAVESPLLNPDLYKKIGIDPPKGILLTGKPGTGKTLLIKAIANSTKATFIKVVGSELVQKYIGEGAKFVRDLFNLAKNKKPSIIFIDEIDAIGSKRIDDIVAGDREVQRTLIQLLSEMDGFEPLENIKIIGATNRVDMLDEALLRPGRFDRIIHIGLPNSDDRLSIFKIHTKKMNLDGKVNLEKLSIITDGITGAEIKSICTEAGMFAIRDNKDCITMEHFIKAKYKILNESEIKNNNKIPSNIYS